MRLGSLALRLGAAGVGLLVVATGCTGGSTTKSADDGTRSDGLRGGTLYVPMLSDFAHLDPARNYDNYSQSFGRLLYRTLTTFKAEKGDGGSQLVGDLATDTGTPSDGAKVWTFTLRSGVEFEDASSVTCADIKYGIARSFDPELTDGPSYLRDYLADVPDGYEGPKRSGKELPTDSIDCTDPKKIVFHLNRSVGDFPYTVALATSAPVPRSKDTGIQFDNRPFSSGPYKIASYKRGQSMTLVRNPHWKQDDDPIKRGFPDNISVSFGVNQSALDQRMIADGGNDKNAVMLDSGIQPPDLPRVLNSPQVRKRSTQGSIPFVDYLAINTKKVTNPDVRKAMQYAVNKEAIRTANGGATAGKYATAPSLPSIPGTPDLSTMYAENPQGDLAKAKQMLTKAKVKTPYKITLAVSSSSSSQRLGTVVQAALERDKLFDVTVNPLPPSQYKQVVTTPKLEPDLVSVSTGADWPSLSTVVPPMFSCSELTSNSNGSNYSQFCDKAVDAEMKRIATITDKDAAAKAWGELETKIMQKSPVIPTLYPAQVGVVGSNVRNGYYSAAYGCYDMVSLAVAR